MDPVKMFDWQINPAIGLIGYISYCVIASIIVRLVVSYFKAWAIYSGIMANILSVGCLDRLKYWAKLYWHCIEGYTGEEKHRDYCSPCFLGLMELALYPVALFIGQPLLIGGWLGVKTAGQFHLWHESRNAFNRFLIGNLLVVVLACIAQMKFSLIWPVH
jgi:hypothetical protein